MGDNKELDVKNDDLLEESLINKSNKSELMGRELVWANFFAEVRELGYEVCTEKQLHTCVKTSKDKRLIPIIQKYIEIFSKMHNEKDYKTVIAYLGDIADKTLTRYVLKHYKNEIAYTFEQDRKGAKYYWSEVLLKTLDSRFINEYLKIFNGYLREYLNTGKQDRFLNCNNIILLLSELEVVEAIPNLINILHSDDSLLIYHCRDIVIEALGNYKLVELKPYIEPFLTNSNTDTRNCAKAAIAKIERGETKCSTRL